MSTTVLGPIVVRYRNGEQSVSTGRRLVSETLQDDVEETCVSVGSCLSLTSFPVSLNDSIMVSPDKTKLSPTSMRATSPKGAGRGPSKHQ